MKENIANSTHFGEIDRILCKKFWYGGKAYFPFHHPANKVQNALMIMLDGCPQYKFKVCKNGKLRLMRIYRRKNRKNHNFILNIKPLQTITYRNLLHRLRSVSDKYSAENIFNKVSAMPMGTLIEKMCFSKNSIK